MDIKKEIRSGIFYTLIFKYSNFGIQLLITAVLSRLLTPEDFGIVAIISVFLTFFYLISNFGLGPGIIQKQNLTSENIFSLFFLTFIFAIIISLLFLIAGPIIANFYNNQEYIKITRLLSISLFFHTLNMVPYNILIKEKKFKAVGSRSLFVGIFTGIIAIIMAYNNYNYYALVYRGIIDASLTFILNYKLARIKVYFNISFRIFREIFNYSFFQFLYNVFDNISKNIDTLFIGKYLGTTDLGYYDRSYRLMTTFTNLTFVFSSVLHPVLSQYQNDKNLLFNAFQKITKFLFIIGLPVTIFLFFSSEEIIRIIYGNQWLRSIPAFKFMSLIVFINIMLASTISFFQLLGKTLYLFLYGLLYFFLLLIAVLLGVFVSNNFTSVAFFVVCANMMIFVVAYYLLVIKLFNKNIFEFASYLSPGLFIGMALIISNILLTSFFKIDNLIISLIIKASLSGGVFIIMLLALNEFKEIYNLVRPKKQINSIL